MASIAPNTIKQKISQYDLHRWLRLRPQSYLFSMQSLCTQALCMVRGWDPTSLWTMAMNLLSIYFCLGAFADKNSGIAYNDLMGSFPFMSFDGSICFLILYHYELNVILATPIAGLDNISIFTAYRKYFNDLMTKCFKPKGNIMDNQATKHIKKFLTKNDCKLQVVKPHNHWVTPPNAQYKHSKPFSL
jgi:hypothetical protein